MESKNYDSLKIDRGVSARCTAFRHICFIILFYTHLHDLPYNRISTHPILPLVVVIVCYTYYEVLYFSLYM